MDGGGRTQPGGSSRSRVPCRGGVAVVSASSAARGGQCFIAADVGGTNARIALVRASDDGRIAILAYRRYPCGEYPSLTAILAEFVASHADGSFSCRWSTTSTNAFFHGVLFVVITGSSLQRR